MRKLVAQIVMTSVMVGVITFASSSANADCAFVGLSARVQTPPKTELTGGGGILVAVVADEKGTLDKGDPAMDAKFTLKGGKKPKKTRLAPGLVVYEMPYADQVTPVELFDGKTVIGSVIGSKAKVAQYVAPKVKSIAYEGTKLGYHGHELIQIELDVAIPAGTYAIIVADEKGKARSWGSVKPGSTNAIVYIRQDCAALPNGTIPSNRGDKVTLQFVNAHGRTSDRTQLMTIN